MTTETRSLDELLVDMKILNFNETAHILGICLRTLKDLRQKGAGPRATILSTGRIGFRVKDIREWLDSRAETQQVDAEIPNAPTTGLAMVPSGTQRNEVARQ